jgi:cyclophilin family peptidyl-prolyl cis-trans isomerase
LHNVLLAPIADMQAVVGTAQTVDLKQHFDDPDVARTKVTLDTNFGSIPLELYDDLTPQTVENFLKYVESDRYNNVLFHRLEPGFVLQGGGYTSTGAEVEDFGNVPNEFDASHPNVMGTVAMAKVGGDPDSATSQFFFNLADNRANLDNQNGGFTTFAEALDMTTVNNIAALPTSNQGGAFNALPADASGTVPMITNATLMPKTAFTVISSNPGILNASVAPDGTLTMTPVSSGNATVTVTSTTLDGDVMNEAFAVDVAAPPVVLGTGEGQSRSLVFIDGDGTRTTVRASNATATVLMNGTEVALSTVRGVTTVTGLNLSIGSIALNEITRVSSSLIISSSGGDNSVDIGDITAAGTLGSITATRGNLVGDVNVDGALGRVTLGSINGGSIASNVAGTALTLRAGDVTNASITMVSAIRSITVNSWTDSDATPDVISALDITTISSRGDFGADINTPGGLRSASIRGNTTSDNWNVGGTLTRLSVGSWENVGGNGQVTAGDLGTISSTGNFGPDLTATTGLRSFSTRADVTGGVWNIGAGTASRVSALNTAAGWIGVFAGPVSSVSVRGTLDGTLSAGSMRSLSVGTLAAPVSLTDASVPYSLTSFRATTMTDAEIRSAGSIRSVSVRSGTLRSAIFAGVAGGDASVEGAADFANPNAQIVSARFGAPRGQVGFSESAIIAPTLGSINIGTIADTASSIPFQGVAADSLRLLTFTIDGQRVRLTDATPIDTQLQDQGVTLNNFEVVVF